MIEVLIIIDLHGVNYLQWYNSSSVYAALTLEMTLAWLKFGRAHGLFSSMHWWLKRSETLFILAFGSEGFVGLQAALCGSLRPWEAAPSLLVSFIVCLAVQSGLDILVCILDFSCEWSFYCVSGFHCFAWLEACKGFYPVTAYSFP